MIAADIDPSLRTGEPLLERIDDGFSPPAHGTQPAPLSPAAPEPAAPALGAKSPF
jgi:hypothetical protein